MAKTIVVVGTGYVGLPLAIMLARSGCEVIGVDIEAQCRAVAGDRPLRFEQSNGEKEIVELIHEAIDTGAAGIIINPAAFTHTSVAIRDALLGVQIPFIEVHLSNVHAREPFRHHSYLSDKAVGVICGLGPDGYEFALHAAVRRLHAES